MGREIYLYSINPIDGTISKLVVSGAVDFPTGYSFHHETGMILMATEYWNSDELVGFRFYNVNPENGNAQLLSSNTRGDGEYNSEFYAGYHRSASSDGQHFYRLGYKFVTN